MSFTFKFTDVLRYPFRHGKTIFNMAETDTTQMLRILSDFQNRSEVTSTFNEYSDISNENAI
jgi:hypothetical protein